MLDPRSSGQDIEFRLSGGGAASAPRWELLRAGVEQKIAPALLPCTLEVRMGKVVRTKKLAKTDEAFVVHLEGRSCRIEVRKRKTRKTPPSKDAA